MHIMLVVIVTYWWMVTEMYLGLLHQEKLQPLQRFALCNYLALSCLHRSLLLYKLIGTFTSRQSTRVNIDLAEEGLAKRNKSNGTNHW